VLAVEDSYLIKNILLLTSYVYLMKKEYSYKQNNMQRKMTKVIIGTTHENHQNTFLKDMVDKK